jgi:hypothetical protein
MRTTRRTRTTSLGDQFSALCAFCAWGPGRGADRPDAVRLPPSTGLPAGPDRGMPCLRREALVAFAGANDVHLRGLSLPRA